MPNSLPSANLFPGAAPASGQAVKQAAHDAIDGRREARRDSPSQFDSLVEDSRRDTSGAETASAAKVVSDAVKSETPAPTPRDAEAASPAAPATDTTSGTTPGGTSEDPAQASTQPDNGAQTITGGAASGDETGVAQSTNSGDATPAGTTLSAGTATEGSEETGTASAPRTGPATHANTRAFEAAANGIETSAANSQAAVRAASTVADGKPVSAGKSGATNGAGVKAAPATGPAAGNAPQSVPASGTTTGTPAATASPSPETAAPANTTVQPLTDDGIVDTPASGKPPATASDKAAGTARAEGATGQAAQPGATGAEGGQTGARPATPTTPAANTPPANAQTPGATATEPQSPATPATPPAGKAAAHGQAVSDAVKSATGSDAAAAATALNAERADAPRDRAILQTKSGKTFANAASAADAARSAAGEFKPASVAPSGTDLTTATASASRETVLPAPAGQPLPAGPALGLDLAPGQQVMLDGQSDPSLQGDLDLSLTRTEVRTVGGDRTGANLPRFTPQSASHLAGQITRHFNNGNRVFDIRLDPAELGRVDVRLEMRADNRVHAVLSVERSDTLMELQRGSRELERALQEAGIDLSEEGLSFQLSEGGDQPGQSGEHEAGESLPVFAQGHGYGLEADEELPAVPATAYGFQLSRREGVDVRV